MKLSDVILPVYRDIYGPYIKGELDRVILKGGRGSGKTTFICRLLILGMLKNYEKGKHGDVVVIRAVSRTHRTTTVPSIVQAIYDLGVVNLFYIHENTHTIDFYPDGKPKPGTPHRKAPYSSFVFLGCDNVGKIRGYKSKPGAFVSAIWVEESNQVPLQLLERDILQSLVRGTLEHCTMLQSYNPPLDSASEINVRAEELKGVEGCLVRHTTYLDVGEDILGHQFYAIAEELKESRPSVYDFVYLGESSGLSKKLYQNVFEVELTPEYRRQLLCDTDNLRIGMDFGQSDASTLVIGHLHDGEFIILYEWEQSHVLINDLAQLVLGIVGNSFVWGDCSPSAYVENLQALGVNIEAVGKGSLSKGGVLDQIAWVNLNIKHIYISKQYTPRLLETISSYSRKVDSEGRILDVIDANQDDHLLDAMRYALHGDINLLGGY